MSRSRLAGLAAALVLIVAFFAFDLERFLTLEALEAQRASIAAFRDAHPWRLALAYFVVYVAVTGLSLPGAAALTLAGGVVFGLLLGTVIVSFASTLGATLAFVAVRFVFREAVQKRFGARIRAVDEGIEREGNYYLFALRLVPAFPFFLVNIAMGLSTLPVRTFYWVSQVGMLAGTIAYVNAGTRLAEVRSLSGILSPPLLVSFAVLGFLPLIARRLVDSMRARRALANWPRPRRFDRDLIVIGAGSAGLVAAYIAAAVKARVTLVEKRRMGGDCLNTGCVPSKALIRSARFVAQAKRAREFGLAEVSVKFDFADVMARVQRVIETVAPHDSVERYASLGVECIAGEAKITSPYSVEVNSASGKKTLTTRNIVIAAGARPFLPPIEGLDRIRCYTSENLWSLRELPKRLVVLGGGPIGSELAQCFTRFGSEVTQVETLSRLLPREDPDISERVAERFRAEGIRVLAGHMAKRVIVDNGTKFLVVEREGTETRIEFDALLCAAGRIANVSGYGLEELGIPTTAARTVATNDYLQTLYPNIYACGDVAGPYQFTHTASYQAWYAAVNALFGRFKRFKVDYSVIPWATFTDPEVARVGLNETEAREKRIAYEVSRYGLEELDRAIADGEAAGAVKVLTVPGKTRILGVTIVGEHAGDIIAEFVGAMKHGIGLEKILGTIHIYPTWAEANQYVAGVWKRAHVSERLLRFAERYHAWQRG